MTSILQTIIKLRFRKREHFLVQGPTIAKFPADPANNVIHIAKGELTGDVKYRIPAEIVWIVK